MLPKQNRLPLRFSRNYVEQNGEVLHSPLFTFLFSPSMISPTQPSRFAFIVSKKISKLAVTRNSIKRLLANSFQSLLPSIKPGSDVILYVKPAILKVDHEIVQKTLTKTLEQAHLL